jgi:hypothetical protein
MAGENKEVKPGYKTTEFWLTMAAGVCSMLYASGAISETSSGYTVLGVVATALGALGYTVSRAIAKK